MKLHIVMMTALWVITSVYGGVIIYRTFLPVLQRVHNRIYLQPELATGLIRQERLLHAGGALLTLLWIAILTVTCWAFMVENPTVCRLYLC